jgi:hypothetical protein
MIANFSEFSSTGERSPMWQDLYATSWRFVQDDYLTPIFQAAEEIDTQDISRLKRPGCDGIPPLRKSSGFGISEKIYRMQNPRK